MEQINVERLVPPLNLNTKDESKRKDVEGRVKEEDLRGKGLINNLISTLGTPLIQGKPLRWC